MSVRSGVSRQPRSNNKKEIKQQKNVEFDVLSQDINEKSVLMKQKDAADFM